MSVVQAVLPVAGLFLLKAIINTVVAAGKSSLTSELFHRLLWLLAGALLIQLLAALARSATQVVSEAQAEKVTEHMEDLLHRKSVEVDLEYYETPEFKNTFHRAQQEAPYRPTRIVFGLAQLVQSGLSLLAISGLVLFSIHWAYALIFVLVALPGLWVRLQQARRMFDWQVERTPVERRVDYYNWMLTGSHHAKENRLYNIGHILRTRAAELRRGLSHRKLRFTIHRAAGEFLTQSTGALVLFGAFGVLAYQTGSGTLSIGSLVMFYQAFQRGLGYFQEFLSAVAGLYENNLFVRNVYAFLDLDAALPEAPFPRPVPRPIRWGICFENVRFQYRGSSRPCLEDVSLVIEPGEVVALVGENGAGKSTLIKLLCRMYDPTDGRITIDGTDIRQFNKEEWRRAISVVFQDFVQYQLPARDNIWLGNISLPADHEAIVRSARAAGADAFIRKLGAGYDTTLGNLFEGGEELSVGQWQKIALARAFLRTSEIIILDEPTSALDPKSEFEVFEKFRQLAAGRSTLLISHRLSTVKMADRIYVLNHGRIAEHGTHDELVTRGTDYADLYNAQAASYR
ncbi:MAG TPA: ABC transporter ATP-binding protein [Candidatus Acidoferrales bacterium]|nr:ABC transporter ATP-binding protein [Candidatus Acidoferrales bacterium]